MDRNPFEAVRPDRFLADPTAADQVELAAAVQGIPVTEYAAASAAEARAAFDARHGRVAPKLGRIGAGEAVPDEVRRYLSQ